MLFKAGFPAIVSARPPRRPRPTACVVRGETEFEVPEFHPGDAPVVMEVRGMYVPEVEDWGGPLPLRMVDGKLYRPLMRVEDFEKHLMEPIPGRFAPGHPYRKAIGWLHGAVRSRAYDALGANAAFRSEPWPTGIEHALRGDSGRAIFEREARAFDKGGRLGHTGDADAEMADWRSFFLAAFVDTAVIDGCVWKETQEPCYAVNVHTGGSSGNVVIPHAFAPSPYISQSARPFLDFAHFFAPDDRYAAFAMLASHRRAGQAGDVMEVTADNIVILDDGALAARDLVEKGFRLAAMTTAIKLTDSSPSAGTAAAALAVLRGTLHGPEEGGVPTEELEDAMTAVSDAIVSEPSFRQSLDGSDVLNLRLHLARMADRRIDLGGPLRHPFP